VNKKFDDGVRVAYSVVEEVTSAKEIQHPIVRAAMDEFRISGGVEITSVADIPSRGTGLGSSSAFTVGLLNALAAYQGRYLSAADLGREACRVEIDLCGEPIGKQDQYACAFGGLSLYEFRADGRVDVSPIMMPPELRNQLERRIIVFYTGVTRSASEILRDQSASTASQPDTRAALVSMLQLVYGLRDQLHAGELSSFGEILHENWELKKTLSRGISNPEIDGWYNRARAAGAIGGKILGAGAGGFLLFYADEDRHEAVTAALTELQRVNFGFDPLGSRIIFYNPT
jgi:D-glycero-alpha-D-manno-heptose-7-phosphate kinase